MSQSHHISLDADFLDIIRLGESRFDSPLRFYPEDDMDSGFVDDNAQVLLSVDYNDMKALSDSGKACPVVEKAGPRKKLYFEPGQTTSAIVTCGGLCPGLNSVIRALVMTSFYRYQNKRILGIPYGFAGFIPELGHEIVELTPDMVDTINSKGGTILGSSRGDQDRSRIVDRLEELKVDILYTIGGDGTQKGAWDIIQEIDRRGLKIAVVGLPKTIDNDINYIDKSFGMETAYSIAVEAIASAHTEARSYPNGIGLVKLMGRESGFVAAYASLASNEVNFCLVPEMDFDLDGPNGFLHHLEARLRLRGHALIVVAEGTGQQFMGGPDGKDASGNKKLKDIGLFLKEQIQDHMTRQGLDHTVKYIDPSYMIRSTGPIPTDSIFCTQLAQMAVHAGMSGRSGLVAGYINGEFTHLPMKVATGQRKKINLYSQLWTSVIEATGQPLSMKNE